MTYDDRFIDTVDLEWPSLPEVTEEHISLALARGPEFGATQIETEAARLYDGDTSRRALHVELTSRIPVLAGLIADDEWFVAQYLKQAKASLGDRIKAGLAPGGSIFALLPFAVLLGFGLLLFFCPPAAELLNNLSLMISGKEFPINQLPLPNQIAYVSPFAIMVVATIELLCHFLPLTWRKPVRTLLILADVVAVGVALYLFASEMVIWTNPPDAFDPPASRLHWLILSVNLATGGTAHLGALLILRGCEGLFTFTHCEPEQHVFHREQLESFRARLGRRQQEKTAGEATLARLAQERAGFIASAADRFRARWALHEARVTAESMRLKAELLLAEQHHSLSLPVHNGQSNTNGNTLARGL